MLTRPSNSAINSQHFTGPSNCATNKQQQTPILPSPPHYHIAPGPIITRPYEQQYAQVTHHLIYVQVIILTLTDKFMNFLAHQAKIPIQHLIPTINTIKLPANDEDTDEGPNQI